MTLLKKKDFVFAFPTQFLERTVDGAGELNQRLTALILAREAEETGLSRSNVGGWHSELDFFKWPGPEVAELFARIQGAVQDYVAIERRLDAHAFQLTALFNGWANVSRHGDYSRPHVHPNSHVSGVYYVATGTSNAERPHSGKIEFLDPRHRPLMYTSEAVSAEDSYVVDPHDGLLLLFPSWLYHYVHPYFGQGERISIAFNATLAKFAKRDAP